jgi:predicted phosphodiesterase
VATLGPRPRAVLDLLREARAICIMGNHDEFLLVPELVHAYTRNERIIEAIDWCREELGREHLEFVRSFERTREIRMADRATLLAFHGTPTSNTVDMLATTSADELDAMLADHRATVMACGHTHVQMMRQHRGTLLVNPGSVGMPFKEWTAGRLPTLLMYAEYAMVEAAGGRVSVSLHRVALDARRLCEAAQTSTAPMREMLVAQYS